MNHLSEGILVKKLPLGVYKANCYIVADPLTNDALIIDAPGTAAEILQEARGLKVSCIVLTHTHLDHVGALEGLRTKLGIGLAMHGAEADRISPRPERELDDGNVLAVGRLRFKVVHTPGHTPGSICLVCDDHLFSGDTLFPGGPGKTANPGDFIIIKESISAKLFSLPESLAVHPGHGPDSVLGKEKGEFSIFLSHPHKPDLHGDVVWLSS